MDLTQLVKQVPGVMVTISAKDLIETQNRLIEHARREWETQKKDNEVSGVMTREQVLRVLNVNQSTLWRWKKAGYLVPIQVGGQSRYKADDINAILEGRK